MALSGVTTFTMTRNDCIKASLRVLRELGAGGVPTIEDYVNCNQALNIVLKSWQMRGIPLWKLVEISFPLIPDTATYPLGLTGGVSLTKELRLSIQVVVGQMERGQNRFWTVVWVGMERLTT